ncbi:unnamed protein product, partial [Ranitomeya imitator]
MNSAMTPNIDRLAREGVKLTQHISAASLCSPSRSAFLTGRYPIRSGMTGHSNGYQVLFWNAASGGLPTNETTFAKILKEQGYYTGIIGKWHLGVNCNSRNDFCHHPLNHGFDYFYGTPFTLYNDCEVSRPSEFHMKIKDNLWMQAQVFIITVLTLIACKKWKLINIPWKIIVICALSGTLYFMYWYAAYAFLQYWNCLFMRNFEIIEQPMNLEEKAGQMVKEAKEFINSIMRTGAERWQYARPCRVAGCSVAGAHSHTRCDSPPHLQSAAEAPIQPLQQCHSSHNVKSHGGTGLNVGGGATDKQEEEAEGNMKIRAGDRKDVRTETENNREAKHSNKDRPFLLFVSFLQIHTPYYTTKEFRGRSQHDLYGDNIEEMDWMV